MIDDVIRMMYKHINEIKTMIDEGGIASDSIFEMQQILGEEYNPETFERLSKEETFHKLTYKRGNVKGNGYMTLYEYLIKDNSNHES